MILEILGALNQAVLVTVLALLCLLGISLIWAITQHLRLRRAGLAKEAEMLSRPLPADDLLPDVLIQVPTFNEGGVIRRIAAAAANLDWPHDRLHVQILDDSTDESAEIAAEAVAALRSRGIDAQFLHRRNRDGFKAGAMQGGLQRSRSEYVAVFDADFIPPRDFLRRCIPVLLSDPGLAFVQAQLDAINMDANALTRAQQRMLDAALGVHQSARSWSGHLVIFSGTCAVWRRAAIDRLGGWCGDIFMEDIDISFRALVGGWRALGLMTVAVPGEVPETPTAWRRQQYRWNGALTGAARKFLPIVWRSRLTLGQKATASLYLASCVFGPLLAVGTLGAILEVLLGYEMTIAIPVLAALAGAELGVGGVLILVLGQRMRHGTSLWREVPRCLASIAVIGLTQLAVSLSLAEGLFGKLPAWTPTPKRGAALAQGTPRPPAA